MKDYEIIIKYTNLIKNDKNNHLFKIGFSCEEGWYSIIEKCFSKINKYIINNDIKDFNITDVKEKLGDLKINFNISNIDIRKKHFNQINKITNNAKIEAENTCQNCGKYIETGIKKIIEHKKPGLKKYMEIRTYCNECIEHKKVYTKEFFEKRKKESEETRQKLKEFNSKK